MAKDDNTESDDFEFDLKVGRHGFDNCAMVISAENTSRNICITYIHFKVPRRACSGRKR